MATAVSVVGSGSQSPSSVSRTIERIFDESQHTGEINLSGRKLKRYPSSANKYDLVDTTNTGENDGIVQCSYLAIKEMIKCHHLHCHRCRLNHYQHRSHHKLRIIIIISSSSRINNFVRAN